MGNKQLIAVCLSALLLAACGGKIEEKKEKPKGVAAVPVTTVQSELHQMEWVEDTVGTLESLVDPVVSAETAGHVAEIRVEEGGEVKAGQILALLDASDAGLSRQAARAEYRRLEVLAANQKRNLERLQQLRDQNFISRSALDDALAQNEAAQNQLAAARAQRNLAERNVGKTQILSPVGGSVEKQFVVAGQYVKVGDPMFQVVSLGKLRARLTFPETLFGRIQRGMKVRLTGVDGGEQIIAAISEIRPTASESSRSFDAFVLLDNPGNWRPGTSLAAEVVLRERKDALSVPEQSVVLRPQGKVVYVVLEGRAVQRAVQTGIQQNGLTEIVGGLRAAETVVVDGAGFLTDQAAVLEVDAQAVAENQ